MSVAKLGKKEYDLSDAKQREQYWTDLAKKNFLGRKITHVRYMSKEEAEDMMWNSRCVVFQLDDGSLIYPSMDDEGNNAGVIFGQTKQGESITCPVLR